MSLVRRALDRVADVAVISRNDKAAEVPVASPAPRPADRKALYLNRKGEVFEEGNGLPIGEIDLGRNPESLWSQVRGAGYQGQIPRVYVGDSLSVFSMQAMIDASKHVFPGVVRGLDEAACTQWRSWIEQLQRKFP